MSPGRKLARPIAALAMAVAVSFVGAAADASPNGGFPSLDPTPGTPSGPPDDQPSPRARTSDFGQQRVVPRAGDYDGDRDSDIAVWRPRTGVWYIKGIARVHWGQPGDIPVQADYDGDGRTDLAVWRPTTGVWWIRLRDGKVSAYRWGTAGDVPYPIANRCGSGPGRAALVVWRPSTGVWWQRSGDRTCTTTLGQPGDIPFAGGWTFEGCGFSGDRDAIGVWRPTTGEWYLEHRFEPSVPIPDQRLLGVPGDIPVPGFESDGCHERPPLVVWRPSTGTWHFYEEIDLIEYALRWGQISDVPLSGNYTGKHYDSTDVAVYRPSTGVWYVRGAATRIRWGEVGDIPV